MGWSRAEEVATPTDPPPQADHDVRVQLLGCFAVEIDGVAVRISPGSARVVALLALHGPAPRELVADRLWPSASGGHALANLRSALWRLPSRGLVDADRDHLGLAPGVHVDLQQSLRVAADIAVGTLPRNLDLLRCDLLPDWYDEWLELEREHHRLLRLQSLEVASQIALERGDLRFAMRAALLAVEAEPLRESAHRCLIAVHLAEGNRGEAARQYDRYLRILDGVGLVAEPSPALARQIAPVVIPGRRGPRIAT